MTSDEDLLYSDLPNPNIGDLLSKLEAENSRLKSRVEELERSLDKRLSLYEEIKYLRRENEVLKRNACSILKTARVELQRKEERHRERLEYCNRQAAQKEYSRNRYDRIQYDDGSTSKYSRSFNSNRSDYSKRSHYDSNSRRKFTNEERERRRKYESGRGERSSMFSDHRSPEYKETTSRNLECKSKNTSRSSLSSNGIRMTEMKDMTGYHKEKIPIDDNCRLEPVLSKETNHLKNITKSSLLETDSKSVNPKDAQRSSKKEEISFLVNNSRKIEPVSQKTSPNQSKNIARLVDTNGINRAHKNEKIASEDNNSKNEPVSKETIQRLASKKDIHGMNSTSRSQMDGPIIIKEALISNCCPVEKKYSCFDSNMKTGSKHYLHSGEFEMYKQGGLVTPRKFGEMTPGKFVDEVLRMSCPTLSPLPPTPYQLKERSDEHYCVKIAPVPLINEHRVLEENKPAICLKTKNISAVSVASKRSGSVEASKENADTISLVIESVATSCLNLTKNATYSLNNSEFKFSVSCDAEKQQGRFAKRRKKIHLV